MPSSQADEDARRGKKMKTSMERSEETTKEERRELRVRSGSPTKENVMKRMEKTSEAIEDKKKGQRGRPLGWRKNMNGMGYRAFAGGNKSSTVKPAKKKETRIVNNIKKKYDDKKMQGVGTRRKPPRISPMKTRGLQKKSETETNSLVGRCVLCRSTEGDLHPCAECNALYHLRKCCLYSEGAAALIETGGRKRWLCAGCTACERCNEYISDPHNVECSVCTVNYHGKCGEKAGKTVDGSFTCDGCIKQTENVNRNGNNEVVKEEKTRVEKKMEKRGRKPKGWTFIVPENNVEEESKKRIEERDALYDNLMDQLTMETNEKTIAPRKRGIPSTYPQKIKKVALQSDVNLFEEAKAALAAERGEKIEGGIPWRSGVDSSPTSSHCSLDTRHQWIYVGSKKHKMESIYSAPYPQEIVESPNVFICPFCLRANYDQDVFRIHQMQCTWKCPPGNEIYREDKKLSVFEVDGADQKLYCRRVCLLGKLFIESKTLVDEVETFIFYVLVEHTNDGCEFVGYFSKEKNPSKNNNLSCILTLPTAMKSGYGRLLIDLSYELSRIEKKIGSPEHPLSDLGLIAYKGFWRSSILCYLRSLRGTQVASVKQISLATRIAPQDVINQLVRDGLLFYKDGMHFVNTEQRAYRMPLTMTRRKAIDRSKLKWEPEGAAHDHLDSSKLNYYV